MGYSPPSSSIKFDANGNVLASINAQTVLSHQTGLSGTPSAISAPVNVGSAINIVNSGRIYIGVCGHVSTAADLGMIRILRTRNSIVDIINQDPSQDTSTSIVSSLFSDDYSNVGHSFGFGSGTRVKLNKNLGTNTAFPNSDSPDLLVLDVLNGDSLQFQVSNNVASITTYIDDLVVTQ